MVNIVKSKKTSNKTTEKTKKDKRKEWIKRKTDWLLDGLAEEILATFKEHDFHDEFVQETRRALVGKNRFAILLWCNELDAKFKAALAERLGIQIDDFNTTLKTLTKL